MRKLSRSHRDSIRAIQEAREPHTPVAVDVFGRRVGAGDKVSIDGQQIKTIARVSLTPTDRLVFTDGTSCDDARVSLVEVTF